MSEYNRGVGAVRNGGEDAMECRSKLATMPILYSDTLAGVQVGRDDLWAVSTADLNAMAERDEVWREVRLNALAVEIVGMNKANGWNVVEPEDWFRNPHKIPAVLALIHSEVSEALEAYRKDDKENFAEELADVLIRVLDCAGGLGINMDEEVANKIEVNKGRGYRHGGKKV